MDTVSQDIAVRNLAHVASAYRRAARRFQSAVENLDLAATAMESKRWYVANPAICRAAVDLETGLGELDRASVEGGGE